MSILRVSHRTEYRYRHPVLLGAHRLMCRPRDSHDLRLLDTGLIISPQPSELRWMHDVFGNSIAMAEFSEPAQELVFESTFRAEHFPLSERKLIVDDYAAALPLSYSASETVDLASSQARHYPDPEHKLDAWVKALLETLELGSGSCRDFAVFMMDAVRCCGLAAQFVSGYLYDEALIDAGGAADRLVYRRCG